MSTPVLPDWFPRMELQRPTAEQLERVDNRKRTLTYAGPNAVIPIVYGEQLVGGPIIAGPVISGSGNLVWAVGICYAGASGIGGILDCRVGDSIVNFTSATVVNSGISVTRHLGSGTTPDSTLVSAIPGFDDVFKGVAYIVCSTPAESVTSMPQVTVRVRGRRCPSIVPPEWIATNLPFPVNDLGSNAADTAIIAVGNSGALATTVDWNTWTTRTSQFGTSDILALGRSGTRNIIVGADGKISTSMETGSSWTSITSGVASDLNAVSWRGTANLSGGGATVGGDAGVTLTGGVTGGTWVAQTSYFGGSRVLTSARSLNLNVWAGDDGKLQSEDVLVDIGFGSSAIRKIVIKSLSTLSTLEVSKDNPLLAVGDHGKCAISINGTTSWEIIDAGFGTENITHAVTDGARFFALSDAGRLRFSVDGIKWKSAHAPDGARKLFYAGGQLVVVDESGSAWRIDSLSATGVDWTENPALHMLDFVTNDEFGMGVNLIGAEAAADIADSLYSGLPRSRTGLTIQDSMTEEDVLALLAQYAEVLWSYDGRDVAIIPDAPVDTVHEIDADAIIGDSINLTTVGLEQVPTQIRLMFSDREEPTWASRPAVAEVPEHTMHGMPTSPSTVPLPGVFNRIEAERRAWQRLMRLQSPGRLEWQMLAPGMPYQAGDVVRLPDRRGLQSVDVRLTAQPTMVAALKYQMVGEIYSRSHYPTGSGGTAVPEGAIMIFRGSGAVPEGWQAFNMNGRLLKEGAPGNAGTLTALSFSLSLASAGGHAAHSNKQAKFSTGTVSPTYNQPSYDIRIPQGAYVEEPPHTHSCSYSSSIVEFLSRRQLRFVKKVSGAGLLSPGISMFFGSSDTPSGFFEDVSIGKRFLTGGTTEAAFAGKSARISISTSAILDHIHITSVGTPNEGRPLISDTDLVVTGDIGIPSGGHSHVIGALVEVQLRSAALRILEATADDLITPGSIVGWEGSSAPAGWAFCDGQNGTIDLRDCFIVSTTSGAEAGTIIEENSVIRATVDDNTNTVSHVHERVITARRRASMGWTYLDHDASVGRHAHTVQGVKEFNFDASNLRRYQLRFIQYIGE